MCSHFTLFHHTVSAILFLKYFHHLSSFTLNTPTTSTHIFQRLPPTLHNKYRALDAKDFYLLLYSIALRTLLHSHLISKVFIQSRICNLRNKTSVPVFYNMNKIWVRVQMRMNLIKSSPEQISSLYTIKDMLLCKKMTNEHKLNKAECRTQRTK